ncbi:MAG: M15 family metallopeptidase [Cyclobacteriaceae bacterium]
MKVVMKLILILSILISCTVKPEKEKVQSIAVQPDINPVSELPVPIKEKINYHDTSMVVLQQYSDLFVYDMKYATADNFLKEKVYECDNCLLRFKVAEALIIAAKKFSESGMKIKFFDCTRPVTVQKKMWEIMPDGRYVANPYKSGSIHNRGAAVDITLVDNQGNELDMGTGFDHFGEEAHHAYSNLSDTVKANRTFLKEIMKSAGFNPIRTEWWHYNYGAEKYKISAVALCD